MRNIAEALVAIAETEEQVYQAGYFNGYLAGEGNAPDIELDSTLTQEGMAADAKAVGDAFVETEQYINENFLALKPTNEQILDFAEAQLDLKNPQNLRIISPDLNNEGFYAELRGSEEYPELHFASTQSDWPITLGGIKGLNISDRLHIVSQDSTGANGYIEIYAKRNEDLDNECLVLNSLAGEPRISGVGNPIESQDVATKDYVDNITLVINAVYPDGRSLVAPVLENFDYETIVNYLGEQKNVVLRAYIDGQGGYEYYYLSNWALDYQTLPVLHFIHKGAEVIKIITLDYEGTVNFQYYYTQPDTSLSQFRAPADAKAVGDKIGDIEAALDEVLELQNNYLAPDGDEVSY